MTLFEGNLPQTDREREGERERDRKRKRKKKRERASERVGCQMIW